MPIINNEYYYKRFVVEDILKIRGAYFIDVTTIKYYHYKCYKKVLKDKRIKMSMPNVIDALYKL